MKKKFKICDSKFPLRRNNFEVNDQIKRPLKNETNVIIPNRIIVYNSIYLITDSKRRYNNSKTIDSPVCKKRNHLSPRIIKRRKRIRKKLQFTDINLNTNKTTSKFKNKPKCPNIFLNFTKNIILNENKIKNCQGVIQHSNLGHSAEVDIITDCICKSPLKCLRPKFIQGNSECSHIIKGNRSFCQVPVKSSKKVLDKDKDHFLLDRKHTKNRKLKQLDKCLKESFQNLHNYPVKKQKRQVVINTTSIKYSYSNMKANNTKAGNVYYSGAKPKKSSPTVKHGEGKQQLKIKQGLKKLRLSINSNIEKFSEVNIVNKCPLNISSSKLTSVNSEYSFSNDIGKSTCPLKFPEKVSKKDTLYPKQKQTAEFGKLDKSVNLKNLFEKLDHDNPEVMSKCHENDSNSVNVESGIQNNVYVFHKIGFSKQDNLTPKKFISKRKREKENVKVLNDQRNTKSSESTQSIELLSDEDCFINQTQFSRELQEEKDHDNPEEMSKCHENDSNSVNVESSIYNDMSDFHKIAFLEQDNITSKKSICKRKKEILINIYQKRLKNNVTNESGAVNDEETVELEETDFENDSLSTANTPEEKLTESEMHGENNISLAPIHKESVCSNNNIDSVNETSESASITEDSITSEGSGDWHPNNYKRNTKSQLKLWNSTPNTKPQYNSKEKTKLDLHDLDYSVIKSSARSNSTKDSKLQTFDYSNIEESKLVFDETMEDIRLQMSLSEEDREKLKNLDIKISWELPKIHAIDTGSNSMTLKQLQVLLGRDKNSLCTTKFTSLEEKQIRKNWKKFSKIYGFNNPELFMSSKQLYGYFKKKERLKFKQFLARNLPNRRLYSVYHKFMDMYSVKSRGRWTEKEDQLLLQLYHTFDEVKKGDEKYELTRLIVLSKALQRTRMAISRRLKILLKDETAQRSLLEDIDWTPELEGQVVYYLLKKSKCNSLEDLRYATIPEEIWVMVADKLSLPCQKLMHHWSYQLYPQLFARQTVLRHHLYIELICWLMESEIREWANVDWEDVSRRAGDLGSGFLYRCFRALVKNYVPQTLHKSLRACVEHLYSNLLPSLLEKETSYVLKRWKYNPEIRSLEELEDDGADYSFKII